MKLSKIILENNKIVQKVELNLGEKDIQSLSEVISKKLTDYLDIDEQDVLTKVVKSAINDLIV